MKHTLILLAGYPATGKTYLCRQILERYPEFVIVSQDELKEKLWDTYGFRNEEEKIRLENESWKEYYRQIENCMKNNHNIISDYPFSEKQKSSLKEIAERYGVQVITVRLTGDLEVMFQRSLKRDLDPARHPAHLVYSYKKGDIVEDREHADALVTRDVFMERCKNRGYQHFELGYLIEIDATDFNQIDYNRIIKELGEQLEDR